MARIPDDFEGKVKAGLIDPSGFPDVAWFVRDGKVEKVQGRIKIQQLAREDDAYLNQYHGTREAAEEYVESHYEPVKFAVRLYKEGKINAVDLEQMVGSVEARKLLG